MAIQSFEATHELTEKQWKRNLFKEYIPNTYFAPFMGRDLKSVIVVNDELDKGVGDSLTIPKLYLLDPESGVHGDQTLEGNEQDLSYGADVMTASQVRNAVRMNIGLSTQFTARKARNDARSVLMTWKEQELDNRIFKVASEPASVNRVMEADSTASFDAVPATVAGGDIDNIATTDKLTVKAIRQLKLMARTGNDGKAEKIQPYREKDRHGRDCYLFFVDDYALRDLKQDPEYQEYAKRDSAGREKFFKGGVCEIDGVMIIECDKVVRKTNANGVPVAVNLFMGAGALALTWAGKDKDGNQQGHIQWNERDDFDYGQQCGIAISEIKGVKRIQFSHDKEANKRDDNGLIQFLCASVAN